MMLFCVLLIYFVHVRERALNYPVTTGHCMNLMRPVTTMSTLPLYVPSDRCTQRGKNKTRYISTIYIGTIFCLLQHDIYIESTVAISSLDRVSVVMAGAHQRLWELIKR